MLSDERNFLTDLLPNPNFLPGATSPDGPAIRGGKMTRSQEVGKKLGEVSIRERSTYYFYYYFLYFLPTPSLPPPFHPARVYVRLRGCKKHKKLFRVIDAHAGRHSERRKS